ncbi:hypothetical protein MPTK1_3g11280 [Marchantia polymorpha subsp. ruderalis]|uniref:Uncharacterized protein n=2 Tax=Marchantia polymorpha TaxID=3197 RepID=A0A176VRB9_MARPO|nr:hypothetical protein AXG93_1630s1220 [Marchantia polymorpha subsp. ruderalis]PTQ40890.1 hypothetical protein MARPO_0037s0069 [Marchantia polymorpha]BBN05215.1 hypothetical protein Mp_3g11280 [Marchantia polymorpha subsp. ruderalis]|eukprot:PTQ40890.1 hypothetical protein MARPO_0037s0069 [Marchantia polymorpha]
MGSLMAGWQTNSQDSEKAAFKRSTSSVTREEVHRFWKAKRSMMEKQLQEAQRDVSHARTIALPGSPTYDSGFESPGSPGSMSGSPPMTPTTPTTSAMREASSTDIPGWWKKSNWAFLNAPPIVEDRSNRFESQYAVSEPLKADSDAPTNSKMFMMHSRSNLT